MELPTCKSAKINPAKQRLEETCEISTFTN